MISVAGITSQPQETTLRANALQNLQDLKKNADKGPSKLDERLKKAFEFLSTSAGEINDRGFQQRSTHQKKVSKYIANGQEEPEDEQAEFQSFQNKVKQLTRDLDLGTRKVIDYQVGLQDMPGALDYAIRKSKLASNQQPPTHTQQTVESMDVDMTNDDDEILDLPPQEQENTIVLFQEALFTQQTVWQSKPLGERYAENNDYKDFYRTVFDANHPGDDKPPMPHATTWFVKEQKQASKRGPEDNQRARPHQLFDVEDESANESRELSADDSASDVEVQSERTRLTCPITLQFFVDPLRSTKCPHAFEKKYILKFLSESHELAPVTAEQQEELSQINRTQDRARREKELRSKVVRCPECKEGLTEKDLRPDPVLVRMVQREKERKRREEATKAWGGTVDANDSSDDDEADDDLPRGTQRRNIYAIGSSPARSIRPRTSGRFVKAERSSVVPQTQLARSDDEDE